MSEVPKIERLEDLVSHHIGKHKTIVSTKVSRLTQPGDNYGSEMMKVDLKVKNEQTHQEEELHVVAKMIPESEMFRKIFNIQVTFVSEMNFYDSVVPTLQDFQRRRGAETMDIYPKFYGGRKNLDGMEGQVDADAVLLMENIIVEGYENIDRHVGFDLKGAKAVLGALAYFHATPLGLKLLEPEKFEEVKLHLACFKPAEKPPDEGGSKDRHLKLIGECKECEPALPLVEKCLDRPVFMRREKFREPFSTIVHKDMWVNNIMVRSSDEAIDVKFVDFQFYTYESPVDDLIFFLMTSVQLVVLEQHMDELLHHYHNCFVKTLENLKCDTTQFSYDKLIIEIKECMNMILGHCLFFISMIIFGEKGQKVDAMNPNQIVPEAAKKKIWFMVKAFYERGWLG